MNRISRIHSTKPISKVWYLWSSSRHVQLSISHIQHLNWMNKICILKIENSKFNRPNQTTKMQTDSRWKRIKRNSINKRWNYEIRISKSKYIDVNKGLIKYSNSHKWERRKWKEHKKLEWRWWRLETEILNLKYEKCKMKV